VEGGDDCIRVKPRANGERREAIRPSPMAPASRSQSYPRDPRCFARWDRLQLIDANPAAPLGKVQAWQVRYDR
jgi:hypothetical protein